MNADRETLAMAAWRSTSFSMAEDKVSDIRTFRVAIVFGLSADFELSASRAFFVMVVKC